ncbi:4Fe-4S binding domain-containing protein [Caloranaerobacter azorensis DSM 13643]|uniref:4Fe-4S binding domain-containing protein n=1 Tax=Caloranaerobacter azorensis DSM 13643 TaxID=1121264 RepID=A0A1M5S351_9FIRM|nr:4Fe-4S binding protein [Caloranaerobacter azorensis]SHH32891.1 4Fe-4S binding domain-containing protein [Caloranaerobacter azorensis DSM 13643]
MKKAVINPSKCDQSPFCPVVRVCPVNAVKQKRVGFFKASTPEVDPDICIGCGKCVNYCPHRAVEMVEK